MNIIIAIPFLTHSTGGEKQALELALRLKRTQSVQVIAAEIDRKRCFPYLLARLQESLHATNHSYRIHRISQIVLRIFQKHEPFVWLVKILSFGGALRSFSADVINLHNRGAQWAAPFVKILVKNPPKVVWMANDVPFWYYIPVERNKNVFLRMIEWMFFNTFDKWSVRFVDTIIVLDRRNEELVKSIYGRESVIVRSGVDIDYYAPSGNRSAMRAENNIKPGTFVMLQVGTAAPYKASDDHLRALSKMTDQYTDVLLVLVGNGVKQRFEPIAKELGVTEYVRFYEGLADDAVLAWYKCADVFLFCMDQTWGLAPIEAMATGTPAIVSSKTGVAEVFTDDCGGFVYKFNNPQSLAEGLMLLHSDSEELAQASKAARGFITERFSWDRYSKDMYTVFTHS